MRSIIYIVSQTCKSGAVNQFGFKNKSDAEKMREYLNTTKSSNFKDIDILINSLVVVDDLNDFIKIDKEAI